MSHKDQNGLQHMSSEDQDDITTRQVDNSADDVKGVRGVIYGLRKYIVHQHTQFWYRLGFEKQLPYINYALTQIYDQIKAVLPISMYLVLFRLVFFGRGVDEFPIVFVGLLSVTLGLALFMEGLKLALMPLGELLGNRLPRKLQMWAVLIIAFILGVAVTLAEPAIGALATLGSLVEPTEAIYLYYLLNNWNALLVLFVGLGVGCAAVVGILRFTRNWSLKPLIYSALPVTIILSCIAMWGKKDLWVIIGLAWDCGAVTTGPVTVPIILSIGIGVISTQNEGREASPLSGFGIVTLASLYPIIAVLSLGLILAVSKTEEELINAVEGLSQDESSEPWYYKSPMREVVFSIRAILPLVLLLGFVLKVVLKESWPRISPQDVIQGVPDVTIPPIESASEEPERISFRKKTETYFTKYGVFFFGLLCAQFGMIVFNWGLTYGLSALGQQAGGILPAAFQEDEDEPRSPIYPYGLGLFLVTVFGFILGFLATIAEPALNVLGLKVESLTNGEFSRNLLVYSVSCGVGSGIALGVLKIIFKLDLIYMIFVGYSVALVVTAFSSEDFVNVAWDSAGVTTGPVTVPFVLTLGLSLGQSVGASDGFGILTLASVGPIISVLTVGLLNRAKSFVVKKYKALVDETDMEMDQVAE